MSEIFLDKEIVEQQISKMNAASEGLKQEVAVGCDSKLPTVEAYMSVLVDLHITLKTYAAMIQRDCDLINNYIQGIENADK